MSSAMLASPCVLVVDDDADIRALLHEALTLAGCRIVEAASGDAGLIAFEAEQPDVVLLDARMPGMDGITACASIRAMPDGANVPILIVTGLGDDAVIDRAFAAGATDFVTKPFRISVLQHRVRHLAEAYQAQALLHIRDRAIAANTNGIIITDARQPNNPVISVNPAFEQLTDYAADEVIGRNCRMLQGPQTDPKTVAELRAAVRAGQPISTEILNYRKDGTPFWSALAITPLRDRENRLTHFVGVQQDITERKRMEATLRMSEERFRLLFEYSPDAIWLLDPHDPNVPWSIVDCNAAACEMHGYTREELLGQPISLFALRPEDRQRVDQDSPKVAEMVREGRVRGDDVHRRKDGTLIHIEYTDTMVMIDGRQLALSIDRDVTERHRAEEALRASEARYRTLFEHFPNGAVFLFDHNLRLLLAGGADLAMSGWTMDEVKGKTLWEIYPPEVAARDEPALRAALAGHTTRAEVQFGEKMFAVHTLPVHDELGTITGGMVMTQDITERTRFEAELLRHAFYDRLTALPNRALFLDRLGHALDRLRRGAPGVCAVFFLDLDQFKVVNDSLGHQAGDRLLIDTAERLRTMMRPPDTLARLGGDEFAVLVEDIEGPAIATQIAERIHHALAAPFILDGHQVVVSASIGMSVSANGEEQPDDLVRNADIAMYRAKTRGKGQHALFDPDMYTNMLARLQMESDLRHAIEHESFVLHYQPIADFADGRIIGVEALVRWLHLERGMIPPTAFIPVAEETGLIVPLGAWVLRAACLQMVAWQAAGVAPLYITVNVSVQQLHQDDLVGVVRTVLRETGLAPTALAVEVTETGMMEDVARATSVLADVRELGVARLAVDDWGTGYASLSYLQQLPVTHIKIDRAFVRDMTTNANNATLVRTMIAMAHGLNLKVIAEGVETEDQRALLDSYGCDAYQGYLVSRPLPAETLLPRLQMGR